ncbi:MAG TPA: DUF4097 family beta strand repeat-containing protein [Thermoanaerobaculia bacterium]|nr:DUF4097 family beta strand repeat-containing protein [Thermoanaerobaculia bacterium]
MRPSLTTLLLVFCLTVAAHPASCTDEKTTGWIEESRTLRQNWTLPAGARTVEVDNYTGPIVVTARPGDRVEAIVRETVAGRSPEKLAEARRQVTLAMEQRADGVHLVVDGPFRCRDGRMGSWNDDWHGWRRAGYKVTYAFELQVPERADLVLATVDGGDVRVRGVHGRFEVHNVNGDVTLDQVGGSAEVKTVNGPVRVTFASNPTGPSEFETVNGDVDVAFRAGLDADLRFKTMNGEVFTEFDYVRRSLAAPSGDRSKGRFVLQRDGAFGVTVGGGGTELAFATLNGNILVRNQDQ